MSGIAGFCDFTKDLWKEYAGSEQTAELMGKTLIHRGPDSFDTYIGEHAAFSCAGLVISDAEDGKQPMTRVYEGYEYTVVYNGELYHTEPLKRELEQKGYTFTSRSDTEILLTAYIEYKEKCVDYLNGIFAFAIWDGNRKKVFLCRDHFGVKPLFYTIKNNVFVFGSEIKALFKYPQVEPVVNRYGLCELFGLGPAKSPGCGVYKGIQQVMPGYAAVVDYGGVQMYPYWSLKGEQHTDSYEDTAEKVKELLTESIYGQTESNDKVCSLLSGGVDSSIVSALAAEKFREQGKILNTYSFDYLNNNKYFKASDFQPSEDRPYVDIMKDVIGSVHHYLECTNEDLYDCLFEAVRVKDLPGMADVDSSLLYFCRQLKKEHTVCLSGEGADEIFGGYPWFRDEEAMKIDAFPWSKDLNVRKNVMSKQLLEKLPLDEYVRSRYKKTIDATPRVDGENETERRRREISYLNLTWFMTTLLDRKDRMTMASGVEARVPFGDYRLVQYVYNVPWKYKYHNQTVKGLLRDAMKGTVPEEVLYRRKSPYPKTYDPSYELRLKTELGKIIEAGESPLLDLIDISSVKQMIQSDSDYGKPWFGQLMAAPQMYAYLIEIDYWLKTYNVRVDYT